MQFLIDLWLPILVSAIAVFFCSFIAWAVSPHHKGDFNPAPDEQGLISAIRALHLKPGRYGFPFCHSHAQAKEPDFLKMWKEGPAGMLNIWPQISMGRNMALTFLVFLAVSTLIAYLADITLQSGDGFARVFQVVGTAGVLAYCFSFLPNIIWFSGGGRAALMCFIDGIIYGLVTGAVFAYFWPSALSGLPQL